MNAREVGSTVRISGICTISGELFLEAVAFISDFFPCAGLI